MPGVHNAFDAARDNPDGAGEVRLFMTDLGHDLIFEIEDSGPGIAPDRAATIFDKGVSSKPGEQRGLGLYLVQRALHGLGGSVVVGQGELGGALFTVIVPKGQGAAHG